MPLAAVGGAGVKPVGGSLVVVARLAGALLIDHVLIQVSGLRALFQEAVLACVDGVASASPAAYVASAARSLVSGMLLGLLSAGSVLLL